MDAVVNAPTFPASLESMQRRDAAEAALCMVVIEVVCAAVAGLAWWLV